MSKNEPTKNPDVVWQVTRDGMEPKPAPWGFVGRNPVVVAVPPASADDQPSRRTINLCVAANVPLLVFPTRRYAGVVTVNGRGDGAVIPAGTEIVLTVENNSKHSPLVLESGEGLLAMHPLLFSGSAGVG